MGGSAVPKALFQGRHYLYLFSLLGVAPAMAYRYYYCVALRSVRDDNLRWILNARSRCLFLSPQPPPQKSPTSDFNAARKAPKAKSYEMIDEFRYHLDRN
jgi:hypothetical protein